MGKLYYNHKTENTGKILKQISIIVAIPIILLVVFGGAREQSANSRKSEFYPSEENSVISKINDLLAHMLENENRDVVVRSIDDLNRMYPGLVFDVADVNIDIKYMRAEDIRLVDVKKKEIKNKADRRVYNNGQLAELLKEQQKNMGMFFFRIKTGMDRNNHLIIESIKVVPSVFRVRLDSNVPRATILSNPENIFPSENYCFLTWKNQVIPIKKDGHEGDVDNGLRLFANDTDVFFHGDTVGDAITLLEIDDHYRKMTGNISVTCSFGSHGSLIVRYSHDGKAILKVTGTNNFSGLAYEVGKGLVHIDKGTSSTPGSEIEFNNDVRIILKDGAFRREMVLSHQNPLTVLAAVTCSNAGLSRYTISPDLTDKYCQQVISGLEEVLALNGYNDTVRLTLDPILSKYLEQELKDYTNTLRNKSNLSSGIWEVSMTVMDMATGAILAMPYYRSEDDFLNPEVAFTRKNPALTRRYPGSTFKPLLALASVITCPQLQNLNTTTGAYYSLSSSATASFLGLNTEAWATETPEHWYGRHNMREFLAYSCDVYPVALAALALQGDASPQPGRDSFFTQKEGERNIHMRRDCLLSEQPLMKNLDILYDLYSETEEHDTAARMQYYIWRNLSLNNEYFNNDDFLALDVVSPDRVTMHYSKIEAGSLRGSFVPWVLGQGTNDWNCVKLAEAWCRMLTKCEVKASMVCSSNDTAALITHRLQNGSTAVWNRFLKSFREAQEVPRGTVYSINSLVSVFNQNEFHNDTLNQLVLFSKTGTPSNYQRMEFQNLNNKPMVFDLGMYTFGIMKKSEYCKEPSRGIVCVLRLTRILDKDQAQGSGLWSREAVAFFTKKPDRFKNLYHLTERHF